MRSALRRQPTALSTRDSEHFVDENPAFMGLFVHSWHVSSLRKTATLARICQKSPANTAEIPVLRRLWAETDFDPTEWWGRECVLRRFSAGSVAERRPVLSDVREDFSIKLIWEPLLSLSAFKT